MSKNIHVVFVCMVMFIFTHELHSKANQEISARRKQVRVGISLPEQRSMRWVKIYTGILEYARKNSVDVTVKFSDNDDVLQSYQIKKMVASGIDVLVVSALSTPKIQDTLYEVHSQGVLVIVFDSIIYNTSSIDYMIMFSNTDTQDFILQKKWLVNLDLLREVIEEKRSHVLYFDVAYLIREVISFAVQRTISARKLRNLQLVDNGAKMIPMLLLLPLVITKDNYVTQLIDTHVINEEDLNFQ